MDEPAASMDDVGGQEDIRTVDLMEDSRALEIDALGDGHQEDEQQIAQVGYLFRSLCLFFFFF
jgi:hypothetical protein